MKKIIGLMELNYLSSRGGLEVKRLLHIQLKVVTYASVDQIPLGDIYMVKILTKRNYGPATDVHGLIFVQSFAR